MGRVILPPNYPDFDGPLIFLAGPIQGAPNWHNLSIEVILSFDEGINVASPSRRVDSVHLSQNPIPFKHSDNQEEWEQVDWETFYLNRAGCPDRKGCILFWLAEESEHFCKRAYAQTTRHEIGEWKIWHQVRKSRLVVGASPRFSGIHYIKYKWGKDCPDINIYDNLYDTCKEAVRLANI
ncbi:MAG: nucleoside 2-deoxyribosyltransferase domain-containing protein [Nanoarchaeota archaeon]|nr:nucleoside 2-deoxyribosyltransferase domain-containing protein [Nanoarchaeota archaeon]MBU4086125.1 nucleoside 2-deoxyribosyltransferase domain-containing protein [Nanoarchaeota archaeon]